MSRIFCWPHKYQWGERRWESTRIVNDNGTHLRTETHLYQYGKCQKCGRAKRRKVS